MEGFGQFLEVEDDLPLAEAHGDIVAVEDDAVVVPPVEADDGIVAVERQPRGSYQAATRARTVFMQNAAKRREAKLKETEEASEAARSTREAGSAQPARGSIQAAASRTLLVAASRPPTHMMPSRANFIGFCLRIKLSVGILPFWCSCEPIRAAASARWS